MWQFDKNKSFWKEKRAVFVDNETSSEVNEENGNTNRDSSLYVDKVKHFSVYDEESDSFKRNREQTSSSYFNSHISKLEERFIDTFFLNNDDSIREGMKSAYNAAKLATNGSEEEKQAIQEIADGLGISFEDAKAKITTFVDRDPTLTGEQFTERVERGFNRDSAIFIENMSQEIDSYVNLIEEQIQKLPQKYRDHDIFKQDILGETDDGTNKGLRYLKSEAENLKTLLGGFSAEKLGNAQTEEREVLKEEYKKQLANKSERFNQFQQEEGITGEPSLRRMQREVTQDVINSFIGSKKSQLESEFQSFQISAANLEWTLQALQRYEKFGADEFKETMMDVFKKTNPNADEEKIESSLDALLKEYEADPVGVATKIARLERGIEGAKDDLDDTLSALQTEEAQERALQQAAELAEAEGASGEPTEINAKLSEIEDQFKEVDDLINDVQDDSLKRKFTEYRNEFKKDHDEIANRFEFEKRFDDGSDDAKKALKDVHVSANTLSVNIKTLLGILGEDPSLYIDNEDAIEIVLVSPNAIWEAIKEIYEVFSHEFEHMDERNGATIQKNAAGALGNLMGDTTWGNFMKQASKKGEGKLEKIDDGERGQWKENYENYDNPTLLSRLYDWSDGDDQHLRTIIEMLADRGLLRLDDPRLWDALYELTGIKMPAEKAKRNTIFRDMMLEQMFTSAFGDASLFKDIRTNGDKNFWSKTEERNKDAKDFVSDGSAEGEMAKLLHRHFEAAQGKDFLKPEKDTVMNEYGQMNLKNPDSTPQYFNDTRLDPHMYTAIFTHWMDTQGSTIEDKIFYLVRGVATGFIPFEATQYIDMKGHHNQIAYTNFFRSCNMEKIMKLDRQFTDGKKINGCSTTDERNRYFFEGDKDTIVKVLNNEISDDGGVNDRAARIARDPQNIDKDDWQSVLHLIPPSAVNDLFNLGSGKQKLDASGIKNGLTGFSTRLGSVDLRDGDGNFKADTLTNVRNSLATFVYFDASIRGRGPGSGDGKLTLEDADYDGVPGMAGDAGLTTRQFSAITKNFFAEYLRSIGYGDEKIRLLFNDDDRGDKAYVKKQKEYVKHFYSKEINDIFANTENQEKFEYILEKWQGENVFATYRNGKNAQKHKAIIYGNVSSNLAFDDEEFQEWKEEKDKKEE